VEGDPLADRSGLPPLTYHAHTAVHDDEGVLRSARAALGPHAPRRALRVVDWIERMLLPAPAPRQDALERLVRAGVVEARGVDPVATRDGPPVASVSMVGTLATSSGGVPIYEIGTWSDWSAAEDRIRADECATAVIAGPRDTLDSGWMVYVGGELRGEVGSAELAKGLVEELGRLAAADAG
jgi:hypothetical protein